MHVGYLYARRCALVVALSLALAPLLVHAGSATYSTPATYTWTVPAYGTLTVTVNGAGGGGGGGSGASNCNPAGATGGTGGQSSFAGTMIAYGGGGGAGGNTWSWRGNAANGSPGSAIGGTTNTTGGGAAGGTGGGPLDEDCNRGGNGGAGGRAVRTYSAGQLSVGSSVTIVVGTRGSGGSPGGTVGTHGSVSLSWTDAPTCSITATPSSISQGSSSTLSWTTTNATTMYISGVGYVSTSGQTSVSPSLTTTYNGTATGAGGTGNCARTLTVSCTAQYFCADGDRWYTDTACASTEVEQCTYGCSSGACIQPPPEISFSADPVAVVQGNSSTLTWSSTNANSCTSSDFSTGDDASGAVAVAPDQTTLYGIACTGPGGTSEEDATVSVSCAPMYSCAGQTIQYTDAACATTNIDTCVDPMYCSVGISTCQYDAPEGNLDGGSNAILATPRFVRRNSPVTVRWSVENVESCQVTGTNDDSWTGISGTETSSPISQVTTFTLACDDHDADAVRDDFAESATVRLIPSWFER